MSNQPKRLGNYKQLFSLFLCSLLVSVVLASSGCIGGDGDGEEGLTLTVITRHDTSIQEAFEGPFLNSTYAEEANVTKVRFMQPVPGLWPRAIDQGGIDVAWGGGPTLFDQLSDLDYLEPLTSDTMQSTLSEIQDSIGGAPMKRYNDAQEPIWVAAAISSFGFTVNHTVLDAYGVDTPQTWDDLANPAYFKDPPIIGIGNAPDTTSNTRIYEIILQNYGWEDGWIKLSEIAANSAIYYGSVDVLNAVEIGNVAIATTIDFYGYSSMQDYLETEYIIPQGQSLLNGDPIAIVSNTEQLDAAEAFMEYVLSPEGQSIWLDENINRMPVREDAFETEFGKTRTQLHELFIETINNQGIEFSDALANSYEGTVVPYWEAVLDKPHQGLRDAWDALITARDAGKITEQEWNQYVAELGQPLITLEDAQTLNDQMLTDSAFANEKSVEWAEAKRQLYSQIEEEIENL